MPTLPSDLEAALTRLKAIEQAEHSLYEFVKQAWHVVDPGHPFVPNWHLQLICNKLEAVTRREIKRLIINVPPRSGKSTLVCVLWPVWTWLQDPTHQWLTISHSGTFATRDALKSRRLIQSPWFQSRWGHLFKLTGDQNQKTRYENDKRGYRIALGITGGITGEGGDTILLDDPMDRSAAHSEAERESANTTYDEAIRTRLNDPATGAIVVVMQRLHELDTTGHLLSGRERWSHLCLPVEYDPDHPHMCADDRRTDPGEPLWPARFTPEVVDEARAYPYSFAGQYQQRPSPAEGGMFKRAWFRYAERNGSPGLLKMDSWRNVEDATRYLTVDLAASTKTTGDYTVIAAWASFKGGHLALLGVMRDRLEGPDIVPQIGTMLERYQAGTAWIERIGFQASLIQDARRHGLPVRELNPDKDKVTRAAPAAALMSDGRLWFAPGEWHGDVEHELLSFPNAAHDDIVDVVAYGVRVHQDMVSFKSTRRAIY